MKILALFETHPELVDKLNVAWGTKSFKEIRNLSVYNVASNTPPVDDIQPC